jgi:hypothetical protein
MKKFTVLFLLAAALVCVVAAVSMAACSVQHYVNPRFEFSVDVPGSLKALPESANGDGRKFVNKAAGLEVTVWGSNNVIPQGPVDQLLGCAGEAKAKVTQKAAQSATGTWTADGRINWCKVVMVGSQDNSTFISALVTFPKKNGAAGGEAVKTVLGSLKSTHK